MIGPVTVAVGWLTLVVSLVLLLGLWVLPVAGVATMLVGLLVDLDKVKEPQRAKRD